MYPKSDNPKIRVLSLGAGVQSSTLYLMACLGQIDKPDYAIFADTQFEPSRVYQHLRWLTKYGTTDAPVRIPIRWVCAGNLRDDALQSAKPGGTRSASLPLYTPSPDMRRAEGQLRRQCTREYKVAPITKEMRRLMGYQPRRHISEEAELWMGISTDEVQRAKPNREQWIVNRWPLLELGMSRHDCTRWLRDNGFDVPPKSACIACPYHDNSFWRDLKRTHPDEFEQAVDFDERIRAGLSNTKGAVYVHRSLSPLREIDFRNAEDMGQTNMFGNECEGMCGL